MELQKVREHIRDCFETIRCVLLPSPGKIVSAARRFKGNIEGTFFQLKSF